MEIQISVSCLAPNHTEGCFAEPDVIDAVGGVVVGGEYYGGGTDCGPRSSAGCGPRPRVRHLSDFIVFALCHSQPRTCLSLITSLRPLCLHSGTEPPEINQTRV